MNETTSGGFATLSGNAATTTEADNHRRVYEEEVRRLDGVSLELYEIIIKIQEIFLGPQAEEQDGSVPTPVESALFPRYTTSLGEIRAQLSDGLSRLVQVFNQLSDD